MKLYITLLCIFFSFLGKRESVVGEYYNHFGSGLTINSDSTFSCTWNFHLAQSWTKGKWKVKHDTIYFKIIPVFDTVRVSGKKDTLILSIDQKAELITETNASITHILSTQSQNSIKMDSKLFYKNNKLFSIDERGKLITKKQSFTGKKKYNPWYIRK